MAARSRMVDPYHPAQTEPALDDVERQNAEAFNRLQRLICRLEDFLGRDRQHSPDEPYEAPHQELQPANKDVLVR